jgi:RND family efflux transporter MFP subunit
MILGSRMREIAARCGHVVVLIAFFAPLASLAKPFECLIEPDQVVMVSSPTDGLIDKIYVKRGDRVRAGQALVQLESNAESSAVKMAKYRSQMGGRIASLKHRFEYTTKKAERSQELRKQNFVSAQARDDAESERNIAEADLQDAIENRELAKYDYQHSLDLLNRRTIRSPFDGVVVDRMLNPGDLAEAGTGRKPILKIAHVDPLRVEVVLPVEAWGKLRAGMTAQVIPEVLGGRYAATITVVDSVFDSASGTFGVRLSLPNRDKALPAGIRCHVELPMLKGVEPGAVKSK